MTIEAFIAGGAQKSYRDGAPHPAEAMAQAVEQALDDAGLDSEDVDLLACVEPLAWNYENLGEVVAGTAGLPTSVEHLWVPAGGTSPQDLLHQVCPRITTGEIHCAVICGSEAMRTRRKAARENVDLDWPARATDVDPMRGQPPFCSDLEIQHGLKAPIHVFPLFENAIRAEADRSAVEQTRVAADILAKNAQVAAGNPHAWFQDAPDSEAIGTVSEDNRLIVFPYTKRMNAIMDVDQCAAIVVASRSLLEKRGALAAAAAVLGGTGVEECWNPVERSRFDECHAMMRAFEITLDRAGIEASEISAMDLYSCFPSAIQLGLKALGSGPEDSRRLSLTGGLAFAGGPGNAYVLHSLAAALTEVRNHPESRVFVTGIGMANTKHAATVLCGSDHAPADATGTTTYRETLGEEPLRIEPAPEGTATIVTYCIEYNRDNTPANVVLIIDLDDGARSVANVADVSGFTAAVMDHEVIGRKGTVAHDGNLNRNLFEFS